MIQKEGSARRLWMHGEFLLFYCCSFGWTDSSKLVSKDNLVQIYRLTGIPNSKYSNSKCMSALSYLHLSCNGM